MKYLCPGDGNCGDCLDRIPPSPDLVFDVVEICSMSDDVLINLSPSSLHYHFYYFTHW